MYSTHILINADVEEISQFYEGLQPEELNTPFNHMARSAVMITSPIEAAFSSFSLSPMEDLEHSSNGNIICICALVLQVNKDKGWFYDACKKCQKKLEPDGAIFFCHYCSGLVNTSTKRYKIQLMVIDDSGTANITVFEREVFNYIGITANDLVAQYSEPEKLESFVGKMIVFKIDVKEKVKNKGIANKVHGDTIDLTSVVDDLTTLVNNKATELAEVEGCRLSFSENVTSPSAETLIACKRVIIDLSNEG
ncbi:replication protein A 70 kDa DNA-binding subunit B-like [Senna tora]|uniref:Replication protein A 70 kDa DNA-binding subunit B-like n=1 Tax=Senna tora TaxID=362788 RepID=A0A835CE96_9FABA|nr:replication protein A 70 kDa DNA-binding subunit B-like [Senna tora]